MGVAEISLSIPTEVVEGHTSAIGHSVLDTQIPIYLHNVPVSGG